MDHQGWEFSAAQLKTIQEVITLVVFCVFSVVYLKEELKWNYIAGFAMMIGAGATCPFFLLAERAR